MELVEMRKNYKKLNYSLTEIDLQLFKLISFPFYFILMFIFSAIIMMNTKTFKNKSIKKKGKDNLIRNYGIGAQIIKDLKIKKMILITRTPKKVIGLEGYNIKITKQELI